MAATVAGAYKQMIEAAGLGMSVYREQAPDGAARPYAVVYEGIALVHQRAGRGTGEQRIVETIQIDLWQDREAENFALRDRLLHLLMTGKPGKAGASPIRMTQVTAANRLPSADPMVLGHTWNVDVWRAITGA